MKIMVYDRKKVAWVSRPDIIQKTEYRTRLEIVRIMKLDEDISKAKIIGADNQTICVVNNDMKDKGAKK